MAAPAERPDTPEQDLWSSILDSVSKSRSTPSKQILLLGEPRTGKTTLAASLLQKKVDKEDVKDEFALGFDWSDVRDDADEGMRCNIAPRNKYITPFFQIQSPDFPYIPFNHLTRFTHL